MRPIRRLTLLAAAVAGLSACVERNRGLLEIVPDADSVQVVTGITDTGFVRSPMASVPVVVVKDARGFRIPNARVTFTPASPGSGTVEQGEAITDAQGLARPGAWIAGPDSGVDSLVAWVVGPPTAKATRAIITARVIDPCGRPLPYVLGDSVAGTLAGRGCLTADSGVVQPYRFTVATGGLHLFTATSSDFTPTVEVVRTDGFPIAVFEGQATVAPSVRVALAPGTYVVRAGALSRRRSSGTFTLRSAATTFPATCPTGAPLGAFLTPGASVSGGLATGDCSFTLSLGNTYNGPAVGDFYGLFIPANEAVTVRLASTDLDPILLVATAGATQVVTFNDNGGGGANALLSFTAQSLGAPPGQGAYVWLVATSKGQTGTYTIALDGPLPQ